MEDRRESVRADYSRRGDEAHESEKADMHAFPVYTHLLSPRTNRNFVN